MVLEGGPIFKRAPFWGINFFPCTKHEGPGQNFKTQQWQSKKY